MTTKSKDSMSDAYDETQEVKNLCNCIKRLFYKDPGLFSNHSERAIKRVNELLEREIDYQVSQFN